MESDILDSRGAGPPTPRGTGELIDFDELDKVEAERGVPSSREKDPLQHIHEVSVGDKVQVIGDAAALLLACRGAGIETTNDEQRLASTRKSVIVLEKDCSDGTVKCRVPAVGVVWFAVAALMPLGCTVEVLAMDADGTGKHSTNTGTGTRSSTSDSQWTEWLTQMSGLDQNNAVETESTEDEKARRAGLEMEFVKMELEIESCLERRLWARKQEGMLGATIAIKVAASTGQDQEDKCVFIADAIQASVKQIHKSLASKNRAAHVNSERLELMLFLFELVVSAALPCRYTHRATAFGEWLVGLLRDPRRGLCALVGDLMDGDAAQSGAASVMKKVDAKIKEVSDAVRKLLDCMVTQDPADRKHLDDLYGEFAQAASTGTTSWPEFLVRWRLAVTQNSGPRDGFIIRTSVLTITQLLHDLRSRFQSENFQGRYKELRGKAQHGGEGHAQMVEWTFEVQKKVLPMYGFEASPRGMWSMRSETGFHADFEGPNMSGLGDKVVAKLRRDIHACLDMEAKTSARLPMFHTVGDSHSKFGWPSCVIQHWQGPLLCYNVDRVDLRNLTPPIREGDAICLCFGEIDCRCHVHKHCDEGTPYQKVIDGIIAKYFEHLRSQVRLLPQGVKIFVYNVPPPTRRCDVEENVQFPHLGEDEERQAYVVYFNQRLKSECRRVGFRFFDVYDHYADDEGLLAAEYSDGNVHISDGCWIEEVIRGLGLKPSWTSEIQLGN